MGGGDTVCRLYGTPCPADAQRVRMNRLRRAAGQMGTLSRFCDLVPVLPEFYAPLYLSPNLFLRVHVSPGFSHTLCSHVNRCGDLKFVRVPRQVRRVNYSNFSSNYDLHRRESAPRTFPFRSDLYISKWKTRVSVRGPDTALAIRSLSSSGGKEEAPQRATQSSP